MRNEIVASKLNYIGDLHKLFHHDCQLVCSFLGMSRVRRMTIRQRQAQSQFTGECNSLRIPWVYRAQGRYGEAEPLLKHALLIREEQLGVSHPHTAISLN